MSSLLEFSASSACFTVVADADPSVLSRVVEYFVVLDITPDSVRSRRYVDGHLEITVKARGMNEPRIDLMANKLRQIVAVRHVSVEIYAVGGDINDYREMQLAAAQ